MAHEVESMMYDGEIGDPWHLEETGDKSKAITPECRTNWHEALICAGLDWTKSHVPVYFREDDGTLKECNDTLAVVRDTDRMYLGTVGGKTELVQNKDGLSWFQPFLDSGRAYLDTAGSLRGGRVIWAQAVIRGADGADFISIKGDEISKRILLAFSHDNSMGVHLGFTPTRVVCMNTLRMAHNNENSALLRIRKTAGVHINMENAREIMNLTNAAFEATAQQYEFLASRNFDVDSLKKYVRIVMDTPLDNEEYDEISTRKKNIVEKIEGYAIEAEDMKTELKGSYWAAYQGVTRYLSHDAGRNASTRLNSLWFGPFKDVNEKALTVAVEMARAA